jgi:plastocyanin
MNANARRHGSITATWSMLAVLVLAGGAGCAPAPEKAAEAPAPAAESTPVAAAPAEAVDGVVEISVDGTGFHPASIRGHAGQPITLAITRTTDETCGTEIVMPALGINTTLPLNQRVEVTVTPADTTDIAFACAMDMLKGTIVVE